MNPIPNNLGQFVELPKFDVLNRFNADPIFRADILAETTRERRRVQYENDCAILANYRPENFDEEPGFVQPCRERVAAYEMGVGHE